MNQGKSFEGDWKGSYTGTPYYYMRIKDGAKWLQGEGTSFAPENPCDAIQFSMPFIWLLELKSTKSVSVSFFPRTPYKKPDTNTKVMIKPSQVRALMEAVKCDGVIAGFVINFRPRKMKTKTTENKCYFVHINDFLKFAKETGKSTINEKDCEEIGVEISSTLKKVRYKYDIDRFIEDGIEFCINREHINLDSLVKLNEWIVKISKEHENV